MKTYTGTIALVLRAPEGHRVTMALRTPDGNDSYVKLHCGESVAAQASAMLGRKVTFQADLSDRTQCLSDVQLCVRSEFGLRAVREDVKASAVRESQRPLEPGEILELRQAAKVPNFADTRAPKLSAPAFPEWVPSAPKSPWY